jgi:WD40 repeat protein
MELPGTTVQALFDAAVTLESDAQRSQYLDRACPDAAVRREVESLLAAHANPDSVLSELTVRMEVPTSEGIGTFIGRYKLLELLGEGGWGTVWLAEQREPIRRRVALKVIKLGMDTRQVIARFEAERQALALMDHLHIAKVLDAGTTEAGRPYFVMELVRGIPITRFCEENQLPTRERLDLFIKVCRAVQHAHQKGIIHRDLKPSNVLVTLHDGVPVPKVIDFGIAKATQQELTDQTFHTLFQQFVGTPAYVSPEQAEMSGLDIDTRSDNYSLGVLLYELLTGVTPFDGKELLASGLDEMRRTIREVEPVRPSTRWTQLRATREGTPVAIRHSRFATDLDWIAMKCLEKDRTRRYETANGLAVDLQRHLNGEPVVARPPSTAYRFQKMVRRHRVAFTAAGAVSAALIAGLAIALVALDKESAARTAAMNARVEADEQRHEALTSARLADESRQRSEDARRVADLNLYAADMMTARQHLVHGNLGAARKLLDAHLPSEGEDRRGWEWRLLRDQAEGARPLRLQGHSGTLTQLRFSPDGRTLAALGEDFRLWNLEQLGRFRRWDRQGKVRGFDFTRDGRLGVVTDAGELLLLEATSLRLERAFNLPKAESVIFSPVAHSAAVRIGEEFAQWIDLDSGNLHPLFGGQAVHLTDISDDGTLVCGRTQTEVVIWNVAEASEVARVITPPGTGWRMDLKFLPGRRGLLLSSMEREPVLLVSRGGRWEWEFPFSPRDFGVNQLAVSQAGGFLAASTYGHEVVLWNLPDLTPKIRFRGHQDEAWCVAISPDGRRVASGGQDGLLLLWDSRWEERRDLHIEGKFVDIQPVFGHTNSWLALRGRQGDIAVWDLRDHRSIRQLEGAGVPLIFTPDDTELLTCSETELFRWDTRTWERSRPQPLGFVAGMMLDFPMGGPLVGTGAGVVAVADTHRWVHLLDVATGGERAALELGSHTQNMALSPDAHWLAMGDEGGSIHVWDLSTTTPSKTATHRAHERDIVHLSFSPDGRMLATFSHDSRIKLWSIDPLTLRHELRGHKRGMAGGGWSPDGRTLASVDHVHALNLWHVATGRELATFDLTASLGSLRHLAQAAFSPDGRHLVVWRWSGSCQYWRAPLFEEFEAAGIPVARNVTP